MATYPRNHTRVLVLWESCLQGLEILATEPALAGSSRLGQPGLRARTTITVLKYAKKTSDSKYIPNFLSEITQRACSEVYSMDQRLFLTILSGDVGPQRGLGTRAMNAAVAGPSIIIVVVHHQFLPCACESL